MLRSVSIIAITAALAACAHNPPAPVAVSPGIVGAANTIELSTSAQAPASAAIDMPDMQMPPKVYQLRRTGPHTYEAGNVAFPMAGTWRISVRDASGRRTSGASVEVK